MENFLKVDMEKINFITKLKADYLQGKLSLNEAKKKLESSIANVSSEEFALAEQKLEDYGIKDEVIHQRIDEIIEIFQSILTPKKLDLPKYHPIKVYLDEVEEIKKLLMEMEKLLEGKFIKNQWLIIYDKLKEINIHFIRKQNQLFPALEKKGFDKPSKVMWSLDNEIKNIIKKAEKLLKDDHIEEFLKLQKEVINQINDMMIKEVEILFPTALELLTDEEFKVISAGDEEIGYCLIEKPQIYQYEAVKTKEINNGLIKDLKEVLQKHGIFNNNQETLNVTQGKLSLEQINLIFKHLPIDISYVDENDIVKFYSDTKHRIFPRSPEVIGRKVQNCHPRESVATVERIISAFRSGERDQGEFWLEINNKFIYIIYIAVRDSEGNFKGVLEMMQDVTNIRNLRGEQRLLNWDEEENTSGNKEFEKNIEIDVNKYGINKSTLIADIIKKYPYIKDFLINLSPKFNKLKNPLLFKTMSSIATIEMVSNRGGFEINDLISKIIMEIESKER